MVVETKWFCSSNVYVILTLQTCRQRSCMSAGSLEANTERWHYIFPCEFALCSCYQNVEESLISVCTQFWDLQQECSCIVPTYDYKTYLAVEIVKSQHCAVAFFVQNPEVVHRPRSDPPLHFDSQNTSPNSHGKNVRACCLLSAGMLELWPHVCYDKCSFVLLLTSHFVYTKTNSMKCLVNRIPLRIRVHSTNSQPRLFLFWFWFLIIIKVKLCVW